MASPRLIGNSLEIANRKSQIGWLLGLALVLGACGREDPRLYQGRPAERTGGESPEVQRLLAEVQKHPDRAEGRVRLGQAYLRQDRRAEAAEAFQKALEVEPKNVAALLGLSQAASMMNDRPEALALAQQAVQVAPRNAQALNTLGVCRLQAGQMKEAARLFQQALALTPQDSGLLLNMAHCQAQMKRWESAEDYARQAARAAPQAPEPGLLVGDLFLQQGQGQRAVAEWEAVADQHPRSPKVFAALLRAGDALRQAQAPADAVKCYEQALRMDSGSLEARLGKAQALHQQGQWEQAIPLYESALQEDPDHAGAMNNLACLYAEKGQHLDRAFDLASRLVQTYPDAASFQDTLGWVLYRQGRYQEALKPLEKAAQQSPQKGIFHYHRGQTLRALHRGPEAGEALRKALALGLPPPEKKAAEAALTALRPEK